MTLPRHHNPVGIFTIGKYDNLHLYILSRQRIQPDRPLTMRRNHHTYPSVCPSPGGRRKVTNQRRIVDRMAERYKFIHRNSRWKVATKDHGLAGSHRRFQCGQAHGVKSV